MDLSTCGDRDSQVIWSEISPGPCQSNLTRVGLEFEKEKHPAVKEKIGATPHTVVESRSTSPLTIPIRNNIYKPPHKVRNLQFLFPDFPVSMGSSHLLVSQFFCLGFSLLTKQGTYYEASLREIVEGVLRRIVGTVTTSKKAPKRIIACAKVSGSVGLVR